MLTQAAPPNWSSWQNTNTNTHHFHSTQHHLIKRKNVKYVKGNNRWRVFLCYSYAALRGPGQWTCSRPAHNQNTGEVLTKRRTCALNGVEVGGWLWVECVWLWCMIVWLDGWVWRHARCTCYVYQKKEDKKSGAWGTRRKELLVWSTPIFVYVQVI